MSELHPKHISADFSSPEAEIKYWTERKMAIRAYLAYIEDMQRKAIEKYKTPEGGETEQEWLGNNGRE